MRTAHSACSTSARSRRRSSSSACPTSRSPAPSSRSVSAALDAAALDLSFTHVTAPIAGRVSRAVVTVGNLVEPPTVLTTLVSVSPVYAYFDIDEQTYLKHVHGGRVAPT